MRVRCLTMNWASSRGERPARGLDFAHIICAASLRPYELPSPAHRALQWLASGLVEPDVELAGGHSLVGLFQQALPPGADGLFVHIRQDDPAVLDRIGPGLPG